MAGGFVYADNLVAAVPVGLLGLLLLVQVLSGSLADKLVKCYC